MPRTGASGRRCSGCSVRRPWPCRIEGLSVRRERPLWSPAISDGSGPRPRCGVLRRGWGFASSPRWPRDGTRRSTRRRTAGPARRRLFPGEPGRPRGGPARVRRRRRRLRAIPARLPRRGDRPAGPGARSDQVGPGDGSRRRDGKAHQAGADRGHVRAGGAGRGDAPGVRVHRLLKPNGRLGLLWNGRDESVSWVRSLTEIITPYERTAPREKTHAWRRAFSGTDLFGRLNALRFPHAQRLDRDGLVERFASVSFIASLPSVVRNEGPGEYPLAGRRPSRPRGAGGVRAPVRDRAVLVRPGLSHRSVSVAGASMRA